MEGRLYGTVMVLFYLKQRKFRVYRLNFGKNSNFLILPSAKATTDHLDPFFCRKYDSLWRDLKGQSQNHNFSIILPANATTESFRSLFYGKSDSLWTNLNGVVIESAVFHGRVR